MTNEKAVRTREEQISEIALIAEDAGCVGDNCFGWAKRQVMEAEERGVAESRAEDAKGQEAESTEFRMREDQIETMTVHYMEAGFSINAARRLARKGVAEAEARGAADQRKKDEEKCELTSQAVYSLPANIAALEARIKELEAALTKLLAVSRTVNRYGAQTGGHWTPFSMELLMASSILNKTRGETP